MGIYNGLFGGMMSGSWLVGLLTGGTSLFANLQNEAQAILDSGAKNADGTDMSL